MHKIAKTAPGTLAHLILATAGFVKVRDWTQFGINGLAIEPAVVQVLAGLFRVLLVVKLDVGVACENKFIN